MASIAFKQKLLKPNRRFTLHTTNHYSNSIMVHTAYVLHCPKLVSPYCHLATLPYPHSFCNIIQLNIMVDPPWLLAVAV